MRVLAGDVGGTKTLLAVYEESEHGFTATHSRRFESGRYDGLASLLREMLADVGATIDRAAFGIAGPVAEDRCQATNLPWHVDARDLERDLGIARVQLLNDFHAVALGLSSLGPSERVVLQEGSVDPAGAVVVLGAGTGLGAAVLVPTASGPSVLGSEGGHVDFAPRDATEMDLLRFMLARHGRVSVERLLSGSGLAALYDFVVDAGLASTTDATRARLGVEDPGRVVGEAALADADPACVRALELFVSLYGSEAGNFALRVVPTGGLYVAGGIAPRILPRLVDGRFLESFLRKGRMTRLLETIRVTVVANPRVGLLGARNAAAALV